MCPGVPDLQETARVLSLQARRLRIDAAGVGITAARLRVEAATG